MLSRSLSISSLGRSATLGGKELKIITVTVNPALDLTVYTDSLRVGDVHAVSFIRKDSGGKGINVSKVLHRLGVSTIATGFLGGSVGHWIRSDLSRQSIQHRFLEIDGETRTNVKIITPTEETQLNGTGGLITNHDLDRLIEQLHSLVQPGDAVVIAGSIPGDADYTMYRTIIESFGKADERSIFIALDTSGQALTEAVQARPNFVKPNVEELEQWWGSPLRLESEIAHAARELRSQGGEIVCVSMGDKGTLLVTSEGLYRAIPPVITPKSTIGAGDSIVAGFVSQFHKNRKPHEALVYATACGTATVMHAGSEVCTKEEAEAILPQIQLHVMEGEER